MPAALRIDDRLAGKGTRSAQVSDGGDLLFELTFENLRGDLSPQAGADAFVLASVMPLMARGLDVHVEGRVSRALLENLSAFQEYWHLWQPDRYRRVRITADELVDAQPRPGGKVMSAFSGGVDGAFTAYRHVLERDGVRPRLDSVILVQGADISTEDDATFSRVLSAVDEMLEDTGLTVLAVRTDHRRAFADWGHGHGTALAACMSLFQPEYTRGLLASSGDVATMYLPWGSNPVSDHLLSTGSIEIRNDGAGFPRPEKVAALTAWPRVLDRLRVCWQGELLDRNCGQCEKCQRTLLCLKAAGVARPACMPADAGTAPVLVDGPHAPDWRELAGFARRSGRPEVAAEVESILRRNAPRIWLSRHPWPRAVLKTALGRRAPRRARTVSNRGEGTP